MLTVTVHPLPLNEHADYRGVDIVFPSVKDSPNGVGTFLMQSKLGSFALKAADLKADVQNALIAFIDKFTIAHKTVIKETEDYGAELSFLFNESTYGVLHLSATGDHIRFSEFGIEVFYWHADEFKDSAEEILGAICGYLTQNGDLHY